MRQFLLVVFLICMAMFASSSLPAIVKTAEATTKEKAVVKFDKPVLVMGIALQGTYLFIHDDAAMGRGEECTYIYKGVAELKSKLVVSFHCTPKDRTKASHFVVRSIETPEGQTEVTEYQFGGSSEGHQVPLWRHRSESVPF